MGVEEKKDDEKKEEEPKDAEKKDEEDDVEEVAEEPIDETPPKVELTAEEKKLWFAKSTTPDLPPFVLNTSLPKFTVPEKDEGFDEIRYDWSKNGKARDYMKNWVLEKKLITRVENLVPGQWFHTKQREWQKVFGQYQAKQNEWRASVWKKESEKAAKKAAKVAAAQAKAAEKAAKAAAKAAAEKEAAEKAEKEKAEAEAAGEEKKEADDKEKEEA